VKSGIENFNLLSTKERKKLYLHHTRRVTPSEKKIVLCLRSETNRIIINVRKLRKEEGQEEEEERCAHQFPGSNIALCLICIPVVPNSTQPCFVN